MLEAIQMNDSELSIVLTGDDQIQKLNKIYRHKDRPTDVLAFAQRDAELGEGAGQLLGDIVVSIPTARRQALALGRGLGPELTMLLGSPAFCIWSAGTTTHRRRTAVCAARPSGYALLRIRRRGRLVSKARLRDIPTEIRSRGRPVGQRGNPTTLPVSSTAQPAAAARIRVSCLEIAKLVGFSLQNVREIGMLLPFLALKSPRGAAEAPPVAFLAIFNPLRRRSRSQAVEVTNGIGRFRVDRRMQKCLLSV